MSRDPRYIKLINSRRWRRVRGLVLSARPLCEQCERRGVVRAATEVHHIRPLESIRDAEAMERAAYDEGNLMALCHECHRAQHMAMGQGTADENRRRARAEAEDFLKRF